MSEATVPSKVEGAQNEDFGLPGNDLDPRVPTKEQLKTIPLIIRIYGALCALDGVVALPLMGAYFGIIVYRLVMGQESVLLGSNLTLTVTMTVIGSILAFVSSIALILFGWTLMKSYRRDAVRWASALIVMTIGQLLIDVMLQGIGVHLIRPMIQLGILIALSATVDPTLRQERELQRRLRDMQDRAAAEEGMLGRDLTGEGYIKLNFFNLFWVFMVCCVLGLIIEVIFHMVWVDPGVYQDRAGLLFGPFSPIYGFGAVLLTVALNRFYKKNFLVIFIVSAIIGGVFEAAVGWWMQTSFGAIAWAYSYELLPGIPDPMAILFAGRTSTPFMLMWGTLGLFWIKVCLPRLLKLINLIPWKMRYSLTAVVTALMLVNGVMTLQALDCWFCRVSGLEPSSPVEQFYAEHFDNAYMEHRFQTMTIHPDTTSRIDSPERPNGSR
ncbi:putative ABC transporter permease [Collinsella sp. BA40]|uniref:putative ABC transporter permease n=1 Tax=Collinsella sp. BA40 TaxID=2560852 RepID=UPI0011CCD0C9|nr:putative ABC transporter permease [Collinsella sp. BA40]TXF38570.1 putative ABC transporter permease [Collinsella sp. BA40]